MVDFRHLASLRHIAAALILLPSTASAAPVFETIASFGSGGAKGQQPEAGVIVDPSDGVSLFGTADRGGSTDAGTIFKLTPPATPGAAWAKRVLFAFPGTEDGGYPLQLLPDGAGGLFGYTLDGGTAQYGTVFHATPRANPSVRWDAAQLYSFKFGADGGFPGGLIAHGKSLIGVTDQGGTGACTDPSGEVTHCGTVYQLTPPPNGSGPWTETVIYAFTGGSDGATPNGHLLLRGNTIIGTTTRGGDGSCTYNGARIGCGVVYQLSPPAGAGGSWTQEVLYSFPGGAEGAVPVDGVIPDGAGLFGVTASGGATDSSGFQHGTVYHLTKTAGGWQHNVIYGFRGASDGYSPEGGLYFDAAAKALYGTTYLGGTSSGGTVFRLEKPPSGPWSKSIIHSFTGGADGSNPSSALVKDSTGALYGTTVFGSRGGSVYRISFPP